jgi:hypothetical protein
MNLINFVLKKSEVIMFTIRNLQLIDSLLVVILIGLLLTIGGMINMVMSFAFVVLIALRIPVFMRDGWDENGSRGMTYFGLIITIFLIVLNTSILLLK